MFTITKLYELCENRKRKIQIDKNTLSSLLMDNSKMYDSLISETNIEVSTPKEDNLYYNGKDINNKRVAGRTRVRIPETKAETNFKRRRIRL